MWTEESDTTVVFSRLELPGQSLPVEVEPEILLCLSNSKGIGITLEMSPVLEKASVASA